MLKIQNGSVKIALGDIPVKKVFLGLTEVYSKFMGYKSRYLTFIIKSAGTINWKAVGSNQNKTISYSKDYGETWTEITSTSSGIEIPVEVNDKVMFKGTNISYAKDKNNYSGFEGGSATYDIEGNIMSLIYGDDFADQISFNGGTYNFCSLFKLSNAISAENLILPVMTLTDYCYRAMFSKAFSLEIPPQLPATTLAKGVYWYMFEECSITEAPDLLAEILVNECYGFMFTGCANLKYIKCMAISGFNTSQCRQGWVTNVSSSGTFIKNGEVLENTWTRGNNGIPSGWQVYDNEISNT